MANTYLFAYHGRLNFWHLANQRAQASQTKGKNEWQMKHLRRSGRKQLNG